MTQHTHCCDTCGDIFEHEERDNLTTEEWTKAHSCRNGHLATVKYDRSIADRLSVHISKGGDPMEWLAKNDPLSALTLELSRDKEMSDAIEAMKDFPEMLVDAYERTLPRALLERINDFERRVSKHV